MSVELLAVVAVVVFVALLLAGRSQLAKGAGTEVANGATLLVLATVIGILALAIVTSLDVW